MNDLAFGPEHYIRQADTRKHQAWDSMGPRRFWWIA